MGGSNIWFARLEGQFSSRRSNFFWQMAYNMTYHKKMRYNLTNIDYASPIPTPNTMAWLIVGSSNCLIATWTSTTYIECRMYSKYLEKINLTRPPISAINILILLYDLLYIFPEINSLLRLVYGFHWLPLTGSCTPVSPGRSYCLVLLQECPSGVLTKSKVAQVYAEMGMHNIENIIDNIFTIFDR